MKLNVQKESPQETVKEKDIILCTPFLADECNWFGAPFTEKLTGKLLIRTPKCVVIIGDFLVGEKRYFCSWSPINDDAWYENVRYVNIDSIDVTEW